MDDWKHDHLGNQIIILSNQVKHYLHQAAEVEGISGSQSRILHYISEFSKKTEVYQKDVEEFFYLRRSTVTQTLQAMEKKPPNRTFRGRTGSMPFPAYKQGNRTDRSRAGTRSTDTYTCDADGTAAERKLNRGRNHTVFINYR